MRELRLTAPLPILCASLAAAGAAWAGAGGPLQAVLGIALVLVLPGAALAALLGLRLGRADTLLAVCAASIAVSILAGLALGAAHAGFAGREWVAAVAGVSVLASAGALARGLSRRRHAQQGPAAQGSARQLASRAPALALYATAAAVAVLAVAIAHDSASSHLSAGVGTVEQSASERAPLSRRAANAYLLRLRASARPTSKHARRHAERHPGSTAKRHGGARR